MKSFSTPPIAFSVAKIDDDSGVLQKVIVAQVGKVKSYFEQIDATTLSQIEKLGNSKDSGVKARFGHPNMCSSSFGTYIGRFKNFQVDGEKVYGDLHLDDVCKESPSGNLFAYILKMAKNNPDMFGASILLFRPILPSRMMNTRQPALKNFWQLIWLTILPLPTLCLLLTLSLIRQPSFLILTRPSLRSLPENRILSLNLCSNIFQTIRL